MSTKKPTSAKVDYYYAKGNVRTRTSWTISVMQHLHGATTENAVLNFLRKHHSGYEIELMTVDWI